MTKENLKIVAVGGGNPTSTSEHLKKAIEMTGIEHKPHVLIIPTAKTVKEEKYPAKFEKDISRARQLYREELGLPLDVLHGYDDMPPYEELEEKLEWADVALIFGGRSEHMMREWRKHKIDELLKVRALGGLVLSGISAGSNAVFEWGHADPLPDGVAVVGQFIRTDGLGLIKAASGPHFDKVNKDGRNHRREDFLNMFNEYCLSGINNSLRYGFGIDSLAAVVVEGGLLKSAGIKDTGVTVLHKDSKTNNITVEKMSANDAIDLSDL